jgi:hypothetical protein
MGLRPNKSWLQEWRGEFPAKLAKQARTILNMICLIIPAVAFPQEPHLVLKHGVYVREKTPCKGAPNAAIMSWDGAGFSGAHSSKCTSRVVSRSCQIFQVSTTCSALGDGSPNPGGSESADSFILTLLSSTRFEIRKEGHDQGTATKIIDSK